MSRIINKYLLRPIIYDSIFSLVIGIIIYFTTCYNYLYIPSQDFIQNLLSDLATIAFTSAGFILTILTVLVTFKANSKKKETIKEYDSALSLFFNTPLYPKSTNILKNSIKILLFVALFSFLLKAFSLEFQMEFLFASLIFPLILITMALLRCVLLLSKILELQNNE
ncbi:MAG: hypothetical protein COA40_08210 [Aequorivita sp.]|nr:MAG: hypothetical protein COA40_08210 [Aequorivita sp.]